MTQRQEDPHRIPALTAVATASGRRDVVRALGAVGLALLALLGPGEAAAKKCSKSTTRKRTRKRKKKRRTGSGAMTGGGQLSPAAPPGVTGPTGPAPRNPGSEQHTVDDPPSAFGKEEADDPQPEPEGVSCGPTVCTVGEVCCNASCGICTPPGGVCKALYCKEPKAER